MSYAKNLLSRGEEVVFESRQHWLAILGQTWLFVMGAIVVLAILIWATSTIWAPSRAACRSSRWCCSSSRWPTWRSRSGRGATRST